MFTYHSVELRISVFKQRLMAALLPWNCLLCRHASDQRRDLCQRCQETLPQLITQPGCYYCAASLPTTATHHCCGGCFKKQPYFDHTLAFWRYQGELVMAIHQLKFYRQLVWARVLGELMSETLIDHERPQQIIPVPLHRARLRQRGFNQALEIARPLSKALSVPININSCQRRHNTAMQSLLHWKQRYANVRRAFVVQKGDVAEHVAIVDDVMTSGHTVNELSRVLRRAGAKRIDVWCCTRAGQ